MSGDERVDFSGIDAFTRGDQRQARDLRATIAVIARRTEDPSLRELCVKVLRGRESVRRVFAHGTFWEMAEASMTHLERGLDQLSEEQRDDITARVRDDEVTDDELIDAMMTGEVGPSDLDPPEPEADERPTHRGPSRWG